MDKSLEFFVALMPNTRPADYYLGCLNGSEFIDFDNCENDCVRLRRISFDGYGCCDLHYKALPISEVDFRSFKKIVDSEVNDQLQLTIIV